MGMIYGDVLDVLSKIESNSIDTVISSPPYYGLRDYGTDTQWGLEETPELYLLHMTRFMEEIKRVLKDSGTCWINLGDTYAGSGKGAWKEKNKSKETPETIPDKRYKLKEDVPRKSKLMIPERFALNCVMDNWILRNDIIWYKRNRMPFSGKDRFTNSFEHIYFFAKNSKYYFDLDPIREACVTESKPFNVRIRDSDKNRFLQGATDEEVKKYRKSLEVSNLTNPHGIHKSRESKRKTANVGYNNSTVQSVNLKHSGNYDNITGECLNNPKGKNPGDMWDITVKPYKGSHYATFPIDIPLKIIKCACPKDGVVLDPFMGSGTTAQAAQQLGRDWIGIDIDERNDEVLRKRLG